jgi:hypothetical protein
MRTIVLFGCMAVSAVSGSALDRVTVDQLEQRVAANSGRNDTDLAHRLQKLELTQRLNSARLKKLEASIPGPESRDALMALADLSVVLDPPASETPTGAAPTAAEQQQILARAQEASKATSVELMPDFDATVNLTRFRNLKYLTSAASVPVSLVEPMPLLLDRDTDAVNQRQGQVFTTHVKQTWTPDDSVQTGVENWVGLYTVLANVLQDMRDAQPEWARWEQGPTGKLAVFRFSMDRDHARFSIRTVIDPLPRRGFKGEVGYRAEVAMDPATGAVYRFVLRAVLNPGQHVQRADVVAEFALETIDGKTFLCPRRAVTIAVTQSMLGLYNANYDGAFHANEDIRPLMHVTNVEFEDYRAGHWNAPAAADRAFLEGAIELKGVRVSADQLEKFVVDLAGTKDRDAAERLGQLDLTQRLTAARTARIRRLLPGKASSDALLALCDLAEFNDLPRADQSEDPAPDIAAQGKIVVSAVEFVSKVTQKMPDLFAARQLARFQDLRVVRGVPQPVLAEAKPLAMADQSTGLVHFREGREVVEGETKGPPAKKYVNGLDTWGTFGPFLTIVMADALKARIGWSHWETGPQGRLAVFRYAVPESASHFKTQFCCYLGEDGFPSSYASQPGYHGELAIDPETGAVLRLVLKADVRPDAAAQEGPEKSPLLRSDVLVEYGGVEIAGKQYIVPQRTVSVMTSWTLGSEGPVKQGLPKAEGAKAAQKALALMEFSRVNAINEAVFRDYHVFRSEIRLVADPGDAGAEAPKK